MVEWMELVERVCLIDFTSRFKFRTKTHNDNCFLGHWTNNGRQSLHISGVQKGER